ncbi:MAG TPA: glycoside hydrolase family 3 protein, partial [bacterium]|nr:glycoside hydrolase family 3 protein [bacterium]
MNVPALNQKTVGLDGPDPGAVFMIGFFGHAPAPELERMVLDEKVGGVILFGRNIDSVSQTRELIGRLQELRARVRADPLLVAVDQEGGAVNRFVEGVSVFPGNRALGETGNRDWAYRQGLEIGRQLREIGVNVNLAPVLDLYEIPGNPSTGIRSLGPDPARVADLGAALVRGFLAGGVIPVAKHFPGKGAARVDSHFGLPVIDRGRSLLEARELEPFRAAFAAGLPAAMVSHAAYPELERGKAVVPATFSDRVQRDLLRESLGFRGAVVTDDLGMGAVRGSASAAARNALMAGADLLLLCHSPQAQAEAISSLTRDSAADPRLRERL